MPVSRFFLSSVLLPVEVQIRQPISDFGKGLLPHGALITWAQPILGHAILPLAVDDTHPTVGGHESGRGTIAPSVIPTSSVHSSFIDDRERALRTIASTKHG